MTAQIDTEVLAAELLRRVERIKAIRAVIVDLFVAGEYVDRVRRKEVRDAVVAVIGGSSTNPRLCDEVDQIVRLVFPMAVARVHGHNSLWKGLRRK